MLGRLFNFGRQRPFTCADVEAKLEQYRERHLSTAEKAAFDAHLAGCDRCRQLVQTEPTWLSALRTNPAPARLSSAERHAMQKALGRRMRRKMFMRNIRLSMQTVVAVTVLVVAISGLIWWQMAAPTQPTQPTQPTSESSEPTRSTIPTGNENSEVVAIRLAANDRDRSAYEDLATQFMADNPDIQIEVLSIQALLNQDPTPEATWSVETWQQLVSAADVIAASPTRTAVATGFVRDLTPFIDAQPDFDRDDFYPNLLAQAQWQGGTWSIPTRAAYQLIFYNKALFDQAGQAYPQPGWNWDDFLTAAQALRQEEGDAVSQWGFVSRWPDHLTLIRAQAGPLVNYQTEPPTPLFEQPQVTAAVRWYTDLYLTHEVAPYFAPTEDNVFMPETESLINESRIAMWQDWAALWDLNNSPAGLDLGVAPFPVSETNAQTDPFVANGLAMSAGTAQPEAAWRWIDFLSRRAIAVGGATPPLPARRSTAAATGFWQQLDEEMATALRYAIDHSYPLDEEYPYTQHLTDAVTQILSQNESVDVALAAAQDNALAGAAQTVADRSAATAVPTIVVTTPETETAVGEDAVTIRFMALTGAQIEAYRSLAGAFQGTHPHIAVEVTAPNRGSEAVTLPSVAAESDCFTWFNGFENPDHLSTILVLDPFMENDATFTVADLDDFFPSLMAQATRQGQLWALPAEATVHVIEYNKALFDEAGLAYPATGWTTADFLETAVALTQGQGEEKQYGFAADAFETDMLLLVLERQGATLLDTNAAPPTLRFTDPATIEAMRWYANLTNEFEAKPVFMTGATGEGPEIGAQIQELESLIANGQVAMWARDTSGRVQYSLAGVNRGVAPLPAAPDGHSGSASLWSTAYYLSARAGETERRACWEWIKFLSGQLTGSEGIPARRSLAESEAYRNQVGEERAAAYLAGMAGTNPSTATSFYSDAVPWLHPAGDWLTIAYGQAARGELPVAEALEAAQAKADQFRACLVDNNAFYDAQWQGCLAEVDEALADFYRSQGN